MRNDRKPAPSELSQDQTHFISSLLHHEVSGDREGGVVLTPDGTSVAVAPLLVGIEAGLKRKRIALEKVDVLYAASLAKHLALSFVGHHRRQNSERLGPDGCWDDVKTPRVFTLMGDPSPATDALINGVLDGVILGDQLSKEDNPPVLSALLKRYYRYGAEAAAGSLLHHEVSGDREGGVVLTPDGTSVAVSPLLVGIEAGLKWKRIALESVDVLYAAFLAKHLGLSFVGHHRRQNSERLGPDGCWDDVKTPRVFTLMGDPSPATDALINGVLDGVILGDQLSKEDNPPVLSALLKSFLYIHHTYQPAQPCTSFSQCAADMRSMQRFHQEDRGWDDIGYSFVAGSDGYLYEGRGWEWQGAHTRGHNSKGYGVSFIGDFTSVLPDASTLALVRDSFTKCAVEGARLVPDFTVHGHRQVVKGTSCPGDALYSDVRTWKHFKVRAFRILYLQNYF
ncbi:UNVERIFIED_CONTAM: hypothetical protein FKN15_064366 [Acipenser sinensis]